MPERIEEYTQNLLKQGAGCSVEWSWRQGAKNQYNTPLSYHFSTTEAESHFAGSETFPDTGCSKKQVHWDASALNNIVLGVYTPPAS